MAQLTLDMARSMIDAAIARGASMGLRIAVTVVDAGGRLIAMNRMDGALLASVDGSAAKGRAAVFFGAPTAAVNEMAADGSLASFLDSTYERLTFVGGGVPVMVNGELIGGVGVGGGTAEQDHEISAAAIASVVG